MPTPVGTTFAEPQPTQQVSGSEPEIGNFNECLPGPSETAPFLSQRLSLPRIAGLPHSQGPHILPPPWQQQLPPFSSIISTPANLVPKTDFPPEGPSSVNPGTYSHTVPYTEAPAGQPSRSAEEAQALQEPQIGWYRIRNDLLAVWHKNEKWPICEWMEERGTPSELDLPGAPPIPQACYRPWDIQRPTVPPKIALPPNASPGWWRHERLGWDGPLEFISIGLHLCNELAKMREYIDQESELGSENRPHIRSTYHACCLAQSALSGPINENTYTKWQTALKKELKCNWDNVHTKPDGKKRKENHVRLINDCRPA